MVDTATNGAKTWWKPLPRASEDLMNKYLEGGELSTGRNQAGAMRKGTIAKRGSSPCAVPSFKNKGVQAMLDAVIDCHSAWTSLPGQGRSDSGMRKRHHRRAAFRGWRFKIMTDPVRWSADLLSGSTAVGELGDSIFKLGQGQEGASGSYPADARQQPMKRSRKCVPATSPPRGPEGRHHRRHPVCPGQAHHPGIMVFPSP